MKQNIHNPDRRSRPRNSITPGKRHCTETCAASCYWADGSPITVNSHVDTEKVMAWKNGLFNFEGASLVDVMKQIERWYDIEIVYEKGIPDIRFWGKITRDVPLSGMLVALEKTKVRFRLEENRRLVVLP